MTDHNLFQEVDDDIERQKLEQMWKRYGPWLVAGALIVILGTAAATSWRSWHTARNQELTAGLVDITSHADSDGGKQMGVLESFALKNPGTTQASLAQLDAAGIAAKADNKDRAVQLYEEVARDGKADPALRQLADLMSVRTQLDTGDAATLDRKLQPLTADQAPWRYTAMEYRGYLALRAGDKPRAREMFTQLSQDAGAPKGVSDRAAEMLRYVSE